jgi:predicted aspartyl protease
MGMFKQRVTVRNMTLANRSFVDDFWVDTGALYSFVPEDRLVAIGVEPATARSLVLADGRTDRRLLGFCGFEIEGHEGTIPCPVIFAPAGSLLLLGATALENFGVEADPVNKRLNPILAVIGGFLASS